MSTPPRGKKGAKRGSAKAQKPAGGPVSLTQTVDNGRRARFVDCVVLGFSGTEAAERAGYSAHSAHAQAHRLLKNAEVKAEIDRRRESLAKGVDVSVDRLVREHLAVAMADPNDLIEVRRNCCRFCYGDGHRYQMTQREYDERKADYDRQVARAEAEFEKRKGKKPSDQAPIIPEFDELGGVGFDKRLQPNPKCTECFGDGVEEFHVRDSRLVNPSARKLLRGVKVSKDGLKLELADQHQARVEVGKLLGHYRGKGENPGMRLEDLLAASREG